MSRTTAIARRAIKCFAAGTDRSHHALVLHALGYPYRLVSYYYLKEDARSRDFVLRLLGDAPEVAWIMDSGLFSLMFGAAQGTLRTFEDFQRYAVEYVATMRAWKWSHPIVECDIQRVRSVAETHRLRAEVFEPSGMDVIYVWHIPDGEDGLVEMARRYKRIAISIPELRQVVGGGGWSGGDAALAQLKDGDTLTHTFKDGREPVVAKVHRAPDGKGSGRPVPTHRRHLYHSSTE